MNDFQKRYEFRGQAVAVASGLAGSAIVGGSVALPSAGGSISAGAPAIEFRSGLGELRAGACAATVKGTLTGSILDPKTTARSESHVSVSDFHFGGILSIGRLEAGLTAEDPRNRGEVLFPTLTAKMDKVFVCGAPLHVSIDDVFSAFPTKHSLVETYETDRAFRKVHDGRFYTGGRQLDSLLQATPEINGFVIATVVNRLAFDGDAPAGVSIHANQVTINGVGAITFGELRIGERERGLTMVRIELHGTGAAVTSEISTLDAGAGFDGTVEVGTAISGPPRCWP